METLILPIPTAIESPESQTQPFQPSTPSTGSFAQSLEEQDRALETAPLKESVEENAASFNIDTWPPTLGTPNLPFTLPPPPLIPGPNLSGDRGLKNIPQLNGAMSEFPPAQDSSLPIQLPQAGARIEEFPSQGILHLPEPHEKIRPSENGFGLAFNDGWAGSEIDREISLWGKLTGSGSQGLHFPPSVNDRGEEEVLFSRIEFSNLPHPEYPHSAFFSDRSQDPGAALRSSIELDRDIKTQFRPSLIESGREEVYQRIGRRVIWSIHNHEEKIQMDLDPPDLGNIYMEIFREKETIKATLWADNPTTKVALEASQIQLQEILENEGFRVEQFNVFLQQNQASFQERKEAPRHSHSWEPSSFRDPGPEMAPGGNIFLPSRHSSSHYVDVWV